jgi:RimJ/RimL family protein N-acetyltransferase
MHHTAISMPPSLFSTRLLLRKPQATDDADLFRIFGDPRTQTHNPAGPYRDLKRAQTVLRDWELHWQTHGFGQWAICLREQAHTVIGFGGLAYLDYQGEIRLNLGFRFAVETWGQGYATEMANVGLHTAFTILHFPAVYAKVRAQHQASISVLEKVGMQQIDTLHDVPGAAASLVYCKRAPA